MAIERAYQERTGNGGIESRQALRLESISGRYDLVVLGSSLHLGDKKYLGRRSAALVRGLKIPILLIAQ